MEEKGKIEEKDKIEKYRWQKCSLASFWPSAS